MLPLAVVAAAFSVVVSKPAMTAVPGVDLRAVASAAASRALAHLPHHGRVRIEVGVDEPWLIPQLGAGGYTDDAGTVRVTIASSDSAATVRRVLPPTIAHELDHSSRIRTGPGYGSTLGDTMVAEGLADRFAAQLYPGMSFPWDHALTAAQARTWWARAKRELYASSFDHGFWMFGNGTPRWTGYTLGWLIVGRYLAAHHVRASAAVDRLTTPILADFEP